MLTEGLSRKLRFVAFALLVVTLFSVALAAPTYAEGDSVSVDLYDLSGRMAGMVTMTEMDDGMLEVTVMVKGMNPVAGDHLFAATEMGMCGDSFEAAGEIVETYPNVQFYRNGSADYKVYVEGDLASLMDSDGTAVVLYDDVDMDGDRILCGVAVPPGTEPEPTAEPTTEPAPAPEPTATAEPAPEPEPDPDPMLDEDAALRLAVEEGAAVWLISASGDIKGLVWILSNQYYSETIAVASIDGMDPVAGDHTMAIAATDQCEAPDFESAGADEYVFADPVAFYRSGSADYDTSLDIADLNAADLFDADGSSVVIYAASGDDPGDRILCGAAMAFPDFLNELGLTVDDFIALVWGE